MAGKKKRNFRSDIFEKKKRTLEQSNLAGEETNAVVVCIREGKPLYPRARRPDGEAREVL